MKKILKCIYIAIFLLALGIPGVWTLFSDNKNIGNEEKNDMTDVNYKNFSQKFDDYFSMNFGFRNDLVNLNNTMKYYVFKESGSDEVIVGKDGWLFYGAALPDYDGTRETSQSDVDKMVRILEMTQEYLDEQGVLMTFVSAPNKMEVYGEYMPYYLSNNSDGAYEALFEQLKDTNVNYIDAKQLLISSKDKYNMDLYMEKDSHWNTRGASIVYMAIMEQLGLECTDYDEDAFTEVRYDPMDLYGMLMPEKENSFANVNYVMKDRFEYISRYTGSDDLMITTLNEDGSGRIRLFRDSFGKLLYSFFANDFNECTITREIPYDLRDLSDTDVVVMELVERNLINLLLYPPKIKALSKTAVAADKNYDANVAYDVKKDLEDYFVSIKSEAIPDDCVEMYVRFEGESQMYEVIPQSGEYNGCVYVSAGEYEAHDGKMSVIFKDNDHYTEVE